MKKLYLDVDGVFADFESAVIRYTGKPYDPKTSWTLIEKHPNFYRTLYPLSGALRFYQVLRNNSAYPLEFLTSSPSPTGFLYQAKFDKPIWVSRILGADIPCNVVQGWRNKALFAEGNILVDDSLRNIKDWVACGGSGVHHTSIHNTLHELGMMGVFK